MQSAEVAPIVVVVQVPIAVIVHDFRPRSGGSTEPAMEFSGPQYSQMVDLVEGSPVQFDRVTGRAIPANRVEAVVQPRVELEEVVPAACADQCVEATTAVHQDISSTG